MLLDEIEQKVFDDICRARSSYAILSKFIIKLKKGSLHFTFKYGALIGSIERAAIDSLVIALGRLLQPNADQDECTLLKYRNVVVKTLKLNGPSRNDSSYSKNNFKKLTNRNFLNQIKKRQKSYQDQIMPWRNKVFAHSQNVIEYETMPQINIGEIVKFSENVHRWCRSALDDAGVPGEYLPLNFTVLSNEWVSCLLSRFDRMKSRKRIFPK